MAAPASSSRPRKFTTSGTRARSHSLSMPSTTSRPGRRTPEFESTSRSLRAARPSRRHGQDWLPPGPREHLARGPGQSDSSRTAPRAHPRSRRVRGAYPGPGESGGCLAPPPRDDGARGGWSPACGRLCRLSISAVEGGEASHDPRVRAVDQIAPRQRVRASVAARPYATGNTMTAPNRATASRRC